MSASAAPEDPDDGPGSEPGPGPDTDDAGAQAPGGDDRAARVQLLEAVVAHVRGAGLADQSLRRIAEAVGTSHRMLLYHFGTRDGLARAVAEHGSVGHRSASRALAEQGVHELDQSGAYTRVWQSSTTHLAAEGPLLFELLVRTMTQGPDADPASSAALAVSLTALRGFWVDHGYPEPLAHDLADLQLAAGRGLVLDQLLDGASDELDRTVHWYAQAVHPDRPAIRQLVDRHAELTERAAASVARRSRPARTGRPPASIREQLLDDLIANLAGIGFGRLSLRRLAAAAGTSHRMLIYHFASREGLLAALVERIETHQAADLDVLVSRDRTGDPNDAAFGDLWSRMLRRLDGSGPVVFELAVQAMHGQQPMDRIRRLVIDSYAVPLARFWAAQGFGAETAGAVGRLHVAVSRGLMIDYLLRRDARRTHAVLGGFNLAVLATLAEPDLAG